DKEKLVFTGSVDVCVLGYDADGSPVYYERPVEYEYCSELPTTPKSVKCEPHIEAVAINYTMMDNGKIDVRIEINICATVLEIDKMWLLTGIEIDENKCKQRSGDVAIIIYYACGGEKIWDIARQYNTSPEGICSVNEIDGDCIQSDKMLLIPCI
ncbi:MAG: LysM peptidoglycan-binding domain-containing protein, partial [Oscillospiraceae bacterium]